jgi:tetratricopeptide (TPR) repeat protein
MFKIFILFFISAAAFLSQALAKEFVSTTQVINQIEKSLLFDRDARQKIDFYSGSKNAKRSDLTIDASSSKEKPSSDLNIVVISPKSNQGIREKEKFAYNAALITQYEVAIELYKQVIAAEPKNNYAKFSLAVVYQKIGQLKQAKNTYYELLQTDPENREEIVDNLMSVLIEESPKEAIYALSRLALQNPTSPNILAQTAMAYDKVKDYNQAANLLNEAIKLDPERLDYKYNLAVIYDKSQSYDNAIALYGEVLQGDTSEYKTFSSDEISKRIALIKNMQS